MIPAPAGFVDEVRKVWADKAADLLAELSGPARAHVLEALDDLAALGIKAAADPANRDLYAKEARYAVSVLRSNAAAVADQAEQSIRDAVLETLGKLAGAALGAVL